MASSARIDELRKKFDENPRRYFAPLANEYRKAGDLEQAIFICQEYLPQQPAHMSGHIVYGQALFEMGRHDEARVVFETALSLDPENLIALRHLGDIAREAGDATIARMWYQRVLEADPRNEEITQLLAALGELPVAPPTAAAEVPTSTPTPAATSIVDVPAPVTPTAVRDVAETVDVPPPLPDSAFAEGIVPPPLPGAEGALDALTPPPLPTPEIEPTRHTTVQMEAVTDEHELLDISSDDFAIPGTPSVAAAPADVAETRAAPADVDPFATPVEGIAFERSPEPAQLDELLPTVDDALDASDPFAFSSTSAPSTDDPLTAAPLAPGADEAAVPEPPIELATDLVLGLPDAPSTPEPSLLEQTVDATINTTLEPTLDTSIETIDFMSNAVADDSATEQSAMDDAAMYPTPIATPAIDDPFTVAESAVDETAIEPATANAAALDDSTPLTPAPSFVTETMATLYLEQGHLDRAIEIYRELVAQRPDDAALLDRLRDLEARAEPVADSAAELTDTPTPQTYGGPTIREFLSGLVSRQAPVFADEHLGAPDETAFGVADDSRDASTAPEASNDSAVDVAADPDIEPALPPADGRPRAVAEARLTPSSEDTVGGSLGVLFSGADAAAPSNANAEGSAAGESEATPLVGEPAHRASSELSLDHVFKSGSPPRPAADAEEFAFDQFFAEEAAEPKTTPADGAGATSGPEATEDIAQFNSWLNGLKKS